MILYVTDKSSMILYITSWVWDNMYETLRITHKMCKRYSLTNELKKPFEQGFQFLKFCFLTDVPKNQSFRSFVYWPAKILKFVRCARKDSKFRKMKQKDKKSLPCRYNIFFLEIFKNNRNDANFQKHLILKSRERSKGKVVVVGPPTTTRTLPILRPMIMPLRGW